ncbi:MAG: 2-C-methyl-D-erythritol 4-phosphate cytidylyltransferase [Lentisphaerae bacterium]|nr:2-C-methyl-D-erythritol 4-phosphate cytidylyltransferase [Lentisphaerota bacterium]
MVRMTPGAHADDLALVVAAAGVGSRYSAARSKLLESLDGEPVFLHCLRRLGAVVPPERTVLVIHPQAREAFAAALQALPGAAALRLVSGGATRAESVARGLDALPPGLTYVAVQDAARPLTTADLLRRCLESARLWGSGVAARRVTDTIKITDGQGAVVATPDRDRLWAAETPQVFRIDDLRRACQAARQSGLCPTDEAAAVEALGLPVRLVESRTPNPKVTQPADLAVIEALARRPA